ncbi:hypothetical protein EST38_g5253 [Candolleomyces aberdarensis]|uniref:Fungal-type protein kinase domain-containing protein n=1 Tax=Candolleomyces aberdarensis TaxID=2316362 RepID=A0A4Q2DKZ4_9AGAR|nr:hypothetical protein EST38_g5253 [Candolleomyces aberdarensis]
MQELASSQKKILHETPRKQRKEAVPDSKTTDIRTVIGEAMNPEVLICKPAEFQAHHLPPLPERIRKVDQIEAIKAALKGVMINHPPSAAHPRKHEAEAFEFLQKVCRVIGGRRFTTKKRNRHQFRLVPDAKIHSDVNGGNFRIDGLIGEPKSNANAKLHATDIIVPMEFKVERTRPTVRKNRLQVGSSVSHIMNDDVRRNFMLAISIEDDRMTLWYFSRSHSVKSESFDYVKDQDFLIEVLISLMFATDEELGLDPRVQIHLPQEPISTKSKPIKKKGAKIAKKYIYEFPDEVNGSRFFSTTDCISDFRTLAVAGRKTRVFKVIQVEKQGTGWREKEGAEPMVLKDVWLDANARTERQIQNQLFTDIQSFSEKPDWKSDDRLHSFTDPEDADIMQAFEAVLQNGNYKDLFLLIKAESVGHPSKEVMGAARPANPPVFLPKPVTGAGEGMRIPSRQTFQTTNPASNPSNGLTQEDKIEKPEYRKFAPKRRCFLLFADECTPVDYLPTVGDAFTVLSQCIIALRLMFCAGWVHRDISAGNVLALQDANGGWKLKLADLEYAKAFKDGSPPTTDPKTGTPYFMAHEILTRNYIRVGTQDIDEGTLKEARNEARQRIVCPPSEKHPLRHNFQHDLESVFWIALWIVTARIDHPPSRQNANLIFTSTADLHPSTARQSAFVLNIIGTLSECLVEPLLPLAHTLEKVRNDLYRAAFYRGDKLAWQDEKSYSLIHAKMAIRFVLLLEDTRGWGDVPLAPPNSEAPSPAPESAAEAASVLIASRGRADIYKPTKKKGAKISMKYIYEFLDKVDGSRFFFTTHSSISDYRTVAVAGRKTRVFKFIEVEKWGTSWCEKKGTEPMVLKVVWPDTNARTEMQIQDQLFTDIQSFCGKPDRKSYDRLHFFADPEVAGIIQAFKDLLQNKVLGNGHPADPPVFLTKPMTATGDGFQIPSRQTFQVTTPSQDTIKKPDYRKFAPKKRCFHLFAEKCTSVDHLPTVGDAFSVLGQCIIALRLMFCAGWIHRDIAAGNVLALQDANGGWKLKFADLEYAKTFKDGSPPTTDPKTGTPYFMAHEILSCNYIRVGTQSLTSSTVDETFQMYEEPTIDDSSEELESPLQHNFQHDLESVFWIALWIITARIDHTPSIKHAKLIFTSNANLSVSPHRQRAFFGDISKTLCKCLVEPLRPLARALERVRNDLYISAFCRGDKLAWQDETSYSLIHAKMAVRFAFLLKDTRGWGDVPLNLPDSRALPPAPESAAEATSVVSASRGSMESPTICGFKSPAREASNKRS